MSKRRTTVDMLREIAYQSASKELKEKIETTIKEIIDECKHRSMNGLFYLEITDVVYRRNFKTLQEQYFFINELKTTHGFVVEIKRDKILITW